MTSWIDTEWVDAHGVRWHAHPSALRCPSCGSKCAHGTSSDGMRRVCVWCKAERPATCRDYEDVLP